VERDDAALPDERGVHLEILPDAIVPMIPVYEQQVDHSAPRNVFELTDRLLLVGILPQQHDLILVQH